MKNVLVWGSLHLSYLLSVTETYYQRFWFLCLKCRWFSWLEYYSKLKNMSVIGTVFIPFFSIILCLKPFSCEICVVFISSLHFLLINPCIQLLICFLSECHAFKNLVLSYSFMCKAQSRFETIHLLWEGGCYLYYICVLAV